METGRALAGISQQEPEEHCRLLEGPQQVLAEAQCPADVMQFSESQISLFRLG